MGNVAMHEPFADPTCLPDDVPALAGPHVDSVGKVACRRREGHAIESNDLERTAVDVHGVDEVIVRADEAQLDRLAYFHTNHVGRRIRLSVDREEVRQCAFHQHGGIGEPSPLEPLLQLYRVLKIRASLRASSWFDHDGALEPECLLSTGTVECAID